MKIHRRLAALLLCLLLCVMAGCGSRGGTGDDLVSGNDVPVHVTDDAKQTETDATELKSKDTQGMYEVMATNTENSVMSFWNITSGRQEQYAYTDGTYYLDKYGTHTSLSKMMPGIVVSIQVSMKTGALEIVQISEDAWEYDDITRFSVDEEREMFKIADTKYYYEEDLHVFSGDELIKIGELGEKDTLRVQGIGKKILTISVTTGHGVLQLENTELFEGGWLSLGTKTYLKITENMQMELAEGTYLLTVANDGWGGSEEITITRNEETKINLEDLKGEGPQYCKVTFEVGVEEATLEIDGEEVDYSKPVEVRFGIHRLTIQAEGYEEWSKKLFVNSAEATIEIAMTATSEAASETETATETSSEKSSGTTSTTNNGTAANGTSSSETTSSEKNTSEKSTESSSETTSTQSYLDTLSDIISTLTGSSSSSN